MKRILVLVLATMFILSACEASPATTNGMATASPTQASEPALSPGASGLSGELMEDEMEEVRLSTELDLLPDTLSGSYDDPVSIQNMQALAMNAVSAFMERQPRRICLR